MTFLEELYFWSNSIARSYKVSEKVNELIRYLLENKDRVEIKKYSDRYIVLKIDGNLYAFWIYGRFYSYLSRCWNCRELKYPSLGPSIYNGEMPSRSLMKQFYETFELPIKQRLAKVEAKRSYILPSGDNKIMVTK